MCKGNVPLLESETDHEGFGSTTTLVQFHAQAPRKIIKNSVKKNTPVALLYDCFLFMQEQFALNEPIAPLSKSHSDPNNITIDNIHVFKNDENNIFLCIYFVERSSINMEFFVYILQKRLNNLIHLAFNFA